MAHLRSSYGTPMCHGVLVENHCSRGSKVSLQIIDYMSLNPNIQVEITSLYICMLCPDSLTLLTSCSQLCHMGPQALVRGPLPVRSALVTWPCWHWAPDQRQELWGRSAPAQFLPGYEASRAVPGSPRSQGETALVQCR